MITSPTAHFPRQAEVPAFYGRIELGHDGRPTERWEARSLTTVQAPYPMRLAWDPATTVRRITCHRLVAQSLTHCLAEILSLYGSLEALRQARLDLYGGCYNFRPMRGGHALSMHSYGIALDLDPEHNPFGQKWIDHKNMMPLEVVEIFESAGWTWGGRWPSKPDPMHFQAAAI
jgi:hypothetical protein